MARTRRPFDPSATARFMLLCAAVSAGCGLVNIFFVSGSASTWQNLLFFGGAVFCLLVAAELKWVGRKLMEHSSEGNAKPQA